MDYSEKVYPIEVQKGKELSLKIAVSKSEVVSSNKRIVYFGIELYPNSEFLKEYIMKQYNEASKK